MTARIRSLSGQGNAGPLRCTLPDANPTPLKNLYCDLTLPMTRIPTSTITAVLPLPPQATSAGVKDQEAVNYLEKKYRGGAAIEFGFDETVQLAIAALQVRR